MTFRSYNPQNDNAKDNPGVIAPPPLMAAAVIVFGLLFDWVAPAYILSLLLDVWLRVALGVLLVGTGAYLVFASLQAFRAAGTNVEPWKPSTALVANSVYAMMRNPIYVGFILILAGLALGLAGDWMLVFTIFFVVAIHYGVIRREERYLTAKFGEPYLLYMRNVARYGVL